MKDEMSDPNSGLTGSELSGSGGDAADATSTAGKSSASESPQRRRRFSAGAITFAVALGILGGIGTFTFGYGKGASYLSNAPESCVNCHVMQEHLDSWQHSSHHHVAVCNDCHLPHDLIGKLVTKADNGFFHSLAFTLGNFKNPIQIKERNRQVTQSTCVDCHKDLIHPLLPATVGLPDTAGQDMQSCVHCHSEVGHAFRG